MTEPTPEQWVKIYDGMTRYKDDPDDPMPRTQEYWENYREEQARKKAEGWKRYRNWLTEQLAVELPKGLTSEELAEFVMQTLFVHKRLDAEGQETEDCICACHPRLTNDDLHDFGFGCNCGKTAEERKKSWDDLRQKMDEFHQTPEMQAFHAKEDQEKAEVEGWIAEQPGLSDVTRLSWACPEQWQGICLDRAFYFRERHGMWRIEISEPLGGEEPAHHVDTEYVKGFTDYYDTAQMTEIASGVAEDLGETPLDHMRFIVDKIEEYLQKIDCPVSHTALAARSDMVYWYCPHCGVKIV
ncbi:MAG TPA: hypothetical protein VJ742_12860 [Nitrososphaera sp.]|nr:hypothetical protein [Nitrososphaera sp.]